MKKKLIIMILCIIILVIVYNGFCYFKTYKSVKKIKDVIGMDFGIYTSDADSLTEEYMCKTSIRLKIKKGFKSKIIKKLDTKLGNYQDEVPASKSKEYKMYEIVRKYTIDKASEAEEILIRVYEDSYSDLYIVVTFSNKTY